MSNYSGWDLRLAKMRHFSNTVDYPNLEIVSFSAVFKVKFFLNWLLSSSHLRSLENCPSFVLHGLEHGEIVFRQKKAFWCWMLLVKSTDRDTGCPNKFFKEKNVKLIWVKIIGVKCVKLLWVHKCQITMGLKMSNCHGWYFGLALLGRPETLCPCFILNIKKATINLSGF